MAAHKLLLADDSITIQRVIELTFAGEDLQVIAVSDGEQAIARIPVERPDIILADIGMPKRSGYEVSAFVKGHPDFKHLPVLLLAGAFEPVDEAKAQQAGCDGVLVKPFEPQQVIARVRELLDGAKGNPTQAAARPVARPMERIMTSAPHPEPPRAVAPPVESRPVAVEPAPVQEAPTSVAPIAPPTAASIHAVAPAPRAAETREGDRSLDDYFDRLDAAFATLGDTPAAAPPLIDAELNVPTLDEVLKRPLVPTPVLASPPFAPARVPMPPPTPVPVQAASPAPTPVRQPVPTPLPPAPFAAESPASAPLERNVIADVFSSMLALEEGQPGAAPLRLTSASQEPALSDALIDEVVRRVLEKLAPGAARAVVTDVVSNVAERLVREEIARIRGTQ